MKRNFYIILFYLISIASLRADNGGLEVRPAAEEYFLTTPQKNVTMIFHVTNKTSEKQEFKSIVEMPEGWKLITEDFPFELDQNQSIAKLVSFYIHGIVLFTLLVIILNLISKIEQQEENILFIELLTMEQQNHSYVCF